MNTQNQRLEAAKLARQLNAPKTLAILNDDTKNSPIDVILKIAVDEVGLDKLVSVILASEHSFWALGALRHIPNLGKHEASLKEKARVSFLPSTNDEASINTYETTSVEAKLQSIDQFEMYLACGIGYVANFTIWYFTPPFSNFWNKSTIYSGDKIPVCQSQTKACSFFSMENTPLKPGDTVMMTIGVGGGPDAPTNIWFKYDPQAKYTAQVDCHGTTLIPYFSYVVKGNQ